MESSETRLVAGEPGADFAEWVGPHVHAMGLLAARLIGAAERDDVVQEALARAWQKRALFDPARGTARAWLLAIVADRARRARRRQRVHTHRDETSVAGPHSERVDMERAVAQLPPRMRMAVDCVYFVDLSIAETAQVMGVSEGTVKSTLFDARARLRAILEVRDA